METTHSAPTESTPQWEMWFTPLTGGPSYTEANDYRHKLVGTDRAHLEGVANDLNSDSRIGEICHIRLYQAPTEDW